MKDKQAEANLKKYLKAPTVIEISNFIKELGITDVQFERYYKIGKRTIGRIRNNQQNLPPKYWHFIYEKIVPTYGLTEFDLVRTHVREKHNIDNIYKSKKEIDKTYISINRLKDF